MKIICMIPARMSSSRVKKNIRMLGEIPLIEHIINSAKKVNFLEFILIQRLMS